MIGEMICSAFDVGGTKWVNNTIAIWHLGSLRCGVYSDYLLVEIISIQIQRIKLGQNVLLFSVSAILPWWVLIPERAQSIRNCKN